MRILGIDPELNATGYRVVRGQAKGFRFSLRSLLVMVAIASACCYWHTRPEAIALQFQNAVNAGDFEAADELFHDAQDAFIADIGELYSTWVTAVASEQTFREWLAGTCRVQLLLNNNRTREQFEGFPVMIVTARGVQKVNFDDSLSVWDASLWKPYSTDFPR